MFVVSGVLKRPPPIVVVLGATGTGKSKLAIELAQRFNGEVISADAVQMYKGLDIVTNKVTTEERALVKHHCIDFLDPMASSTVVQFRNMALPIIDDVRKREKTPVICGGTNYYIESILWKVLVNEANLDFGGVEKVEGTNQELHDILKEVDPLRAGELHVNERRKVERSLQVFRRHGRPHSEILNEQRAENGGGILGGPMRFRADSVIVIWVQCDQKVLDERCDKRVSKMLESGMIQELRSFHQDYNEKRGKDGGADYTQGIFQTIGFKEFHEYLTKSDEALFSKGVEQMKLATRQYARRQLKWLNQRFLNANRESPRVYSVDTSSYPHGWTEDVFEPASEIVQAHFDATEPARQPITVNARTYSHDESRKMFRCDLCQLQLKGKLQLDAHLESNKHKALVKRKQKREAVAEKLLEARAAVELDVVLKVIKMKPASDVVMKRDNRKQSMANVKSITGLPFHAIKQLLYEKDGDESQVEVKLNNSVDAEVINEGKFDNEHFAIRVETKPLQKSYSCL